MRKISRLSLSVVFCALVFIFAALIFQLRRSTEAVKQPTTIIFKNQTTSIQISNIEQYNRRIKLIAKNIAALPLAVLNFNIEGDGSINVDFTPVEHMNGQLDPGKSYELSLSLSSPLPDSGKIKVTLNMAFFNDGSAEGNPAVVEEQRDIFSAVDSVLQLAKIEIDKISTFDPVALENAKSKINSLSIPADYLTNGQQIGFKSGKDRAAGSINKLLRDTSMLPNENKEERLGKLKNEFGKALPGVNRREK
ncbi:MAG: hypothetical protein L0220_02755 [Acidobacteria bacterium]|nr:hypothetical protein [Acidobacteriota bacterium]